MLTAHDFLFGIIAPAVLAAVAMVLAYLPRRKIRPREPQFWGAALAIAGGFAITYIGIRGGMPKLPPRSADAWLFLAPISAVLIGVIATLLPRQRWLDAILSIGVLALLAHLLLLNRQHAIAASTLHKWMMAATAGSIVWWIGMEMLVSRLRGTTMPLILTITTMVSAAVIANAHSQAYGQLAAGLGAALAAITVLSLYLRGLTLARGGMLAIAAILLGLLLCAHHYADLGLRDLIFLAAAPLCAWIAEIPPLARKPKPRLAVRLVAVLIVLAIPFIPAAKGLKQTMQEQQESYQY
jgi:hypothetical protein